MTSVKNKNINQEITGKYDYEFASAEDGIYLIEIIASAKSWWQNLKSFKSFLNGDNLFLTLDGITEISTSKSNENNARAAWHGNELKGFFKTLLIGIKLKKGRHVLNFTARLRPYLKTIAISRLETGEGMTYIPVDNNPAQKGDSRPWLSFATIDLAIKSVFLSARAQKRGRDDDDIKLIIAEDASLKTLKGELKEYWIHDGKEIQLKYEEARVEKSEDSIHWGVRWLYHKAMRIDRGGSRRWNSWREAVRGYGPNNEKYSNNVWDIYQKGIDKRGKTPVKLWLIFIPLALMILSGAYWINKNQGKVYITYHEEKTGSWLCDNGKSWVEVVVLDGLRLKKARINEVQVDKGDCGGLVKDSLKYSYWDLDKDGEYEIVLDGEWNSGYQVKYFLKNKNDGLDLITIKGLAGFGSGQALVAERAHFIWPEKNGKYTFAAEEVVGNAGGIIKILRDLYHFNDQGEIEFYRREIEKFTGDPTKFGVIAEIPL